jgi:hypothetical protein
VFLSDSRLAWSWNIAHNVKQMASNIWISQHLTCRRDVGIWYNIQQKKEWPCLVCFDYLDLVHLPTEHISVLLIYRCLLCIWKWHIKYVRWKTHIFGNIFREWQMCQRQMESQFDCFDHYEQCLVSKKTDSWVAHLANRLEERGWNQSRWRKQRPFSHSQVLPSPS